MRQILLEGFERFAIESEPGRDEHLGIERYRFHKYVYFHSEDDKRSSPRRRSGKVSREIRFSQRDQFRDQSTLIDRHRTSQDKHDEFSKSLRTVEYQRKGMAGR